MRKKYLSRILLGGLLVASTVAITSCKDYDDDIDDLQSQITSLSSSLSSLQSEVDAGNYVTAVTKSGSTITFTFSGGSSVSIEDDDTITEDTGSIVTVVDGYLYIDGEKTDIAVVDADAISEEAAATAIAEILALYEASGLTTETTEVAEVIVKDGYWAVLQEDGTYLTTEIPVSNTYVIGSEEEGYVLYIVSEDGTTTTYELPTATSSITSITIADDSEFALATYEWALTGATLNTAATTYFGTLPEDGHYILAQASEDNIEIRINPYTVDASGAVFHIVNSANVELDELLDIELTASSTDDILTLDDAAGRGTYNGLWNLGMAENKVIAAEDYEDLATTLSEVLDQNIAYAVGTSGARSAYSLDVVSGDCAELETLTLYQSDDCTDEYELENGTEYEEETDNEYSVGETVTVTVDNEAALYDMFIEVPSSTQLKKFKVEIDNDANTFTIGANPDYSSLEASFELGVWLIDNNGEVTHIIITVNVSASFASYTNEAASYDVSEITSFDITLADLKDEIEEEGDNLDAWYENADGVTYSMYLVTTDDDGNETATEMSSGWDDIFVAALDADNVEDATKITVTYNNTADDDGTYPVETYNESADTQLTIGATYKIVATFTSDETELNTLTQYVTFTAPGIDDQFVPKSAYYDASVEDVIYAYFYDYSSPATAVSIAEYFKTYNADAIVSIEADVVDEDTEEETYYFELGGGDDDDSEDITFGDATIDYSEEGLEGYEDSPAYGMTKAVTVTVEDYEGWIYNATTSFNIKLLSPIEQGTLTATGGSITINANDLVGDGDQINSESLYLYDYAKNYIDIYPTAITEDEDGEEEITYGNPQIGSVTITADATDNYISTVEASITDDGEGVYVVKGAKPIQYESTTTITVEIVDVWGYTLTTEVPVTITVGD